jgi:hypothetical protein
MERNYKARAIDWGLGETANGKEQVAVQFEILTPDADIHYIAWHGYFSDKTYERTIESLRICGWTGVDLTDLTGVNANEVSLVIEDDEWEGKVRPKVKWINRLSSLALRAPMSGDKLKSFAASMRDKIKAHDAAGGTPKPKTQPRQSAPPPHIGATGGPPPISDDDIPF